MKTSAIKMAFVLAAFIILMGAGKSYSQVKVAYVDSETILKQLPEYTQITKDLQGVAKLYQDTITAKENEIKTKAQTMQTRYEEVQKQVQAGQITTDAQKQAVEQELQTMQTEVRTLDESLTYYKQFADRDLASRQQEMFKPVQEKVTKTIESVAKEMKINFVLDKSTGAMVYGDKEFDITFKVLDKLK